MQFWGYWRFMQIRQRIFNRTDVQIKHFILDKILKLLTYYVPFYHQSLQSYLISKQSSVFWPTLYSSIFRWRRNDMAEGSSLRSGAGSAFHVDGSATAKLHGP